MKLNDSVSWIQMGVLIIILQNSKELTASHKYLRNKILFPNIKFRKYFRSNLEPGYGRGMPEKIEV